MMKNRIELEVAAQLQGDQYSFREKKGTTHAIFIAHRLPEYAERAGIDGQMVLLDWEKALDRMDHSWLMKGLRSYGLTDKMMKTIEGMYANPSFDVEVDGARSSKRTQHRGIRQGCPLSLYTCAHNGDEQDF